MTRLTRDTSISLGLVAALLGGVAWLTELNFKVGAMGASINKLETMAEDIAEIKGMLKILLKKEN